MRYDDPDEIGLSQHRASRLPGMLVMVAALGVALIAAWMFTSRDSAATAGLFARSKLRPAAQEQAPAPTLAVADTAAPTPWSPPPWRQNRSIQVAAPATAPVPPADSGSVQVAAAAPQDTPAAEPSETVPLPQKRPTRLIAASLIIPLPRPRPGIEGDPAPQPSTFDLQVERMR